MRPSLVWLGVLVFFCLDRCAREQTWLRDLDSKFISIFRVLPSIRCSPPYSRPIHLSPRRTGAPSFVGSSKSAVKTSKPRQWRISSFSIYASSHDNDACRCSLISRRPLDYARLACTTNVWRRTDGNSSFREPSFTLNKMSKPFFLFSVEKNSNTSVKYRLTYQAYQLLLFLSPNFGSITKGF